MNIADLENKLLIVSERTGVSAYDFDFDLHFTCGHPYRIDTERPCVLRIGAIDDYAALFDEHLASGLRLVNTPAEHRLASELESWYPRIEDFTPRTRIFDRLPPVEEIEASFTWPIFLKGSRQTSRHNPELSVIRDRDHYRQAVQSYQQDPILHWQKPAVREFVPLAPVAGTVAGKIRPSIEYRSFWWHGECVGWGRYWYQIAPYDCPDAETGLALAGRAAARLAVPFLVVDFAKTRDGDWIVIECNDAQESGYVAIPPHRLWQRVLASVEREMGGQAKHTDGSPGVS